LDDNIYADNGSDEEPAHIFVWTDRSLTPLPSTQAPKKKKVPSPSLDDSSEEDQHQQETQRKQSVKKLAEKPDLKHRRKPPPPPSLSDDEVIFFDSDVDEDRKLKKQKKDNKKKVCLCCNRFTDFMPNASWTGFRKAQGAIQGRGGYRLSFKLRTNRTVDRSRCLRR